MHRSISKTISSFPMSDIFKFAAKFCILRMHWRIDMKLGMRLRLPVDFWVAAQFARMSPLSIHWVLQNPMVHVFQQPKRITLMLHFYAIGELGSAT